MEIGLGPQEPQLVKEVLHSCQGISGRYVFLQGSGDAAAFACVPGAEIPLTQQQLIGKIAELVRRTTRPAASRPPAGLHTGCVPGRPARTHKPTSR